MFTLLTLKIHSTCRVIHDIYVKGGKLVLRILTIWFDCELF